VVADRLRKVRAGSGHRRRTQVERGVDNLRAKIEGSSDVCAFASEALKARHCKKEGAIVRRKIIKRLKCSGGKRRHCAEW
jgi:hypothetical protein